VFDPKRLRDDYFLTAGKLAPHRNDAEAAVIAVVRSVVTHAPGGGAKIDRNSEIATAANHVNIVVSVLNPRAAV
jgi:hypothetical protein